MDNLTPRKIVEELDKYIVGQHKAKKAVAIAMRNRWRRQRLSPDMKDKFLGYLVLKVIHVLSLETSPDISAHLKLHQSVIDKLLTGLKQQSLVEILGSVSANVPILRYGLTGAGREAAIVAAQQCEYIGPAPVTLASYQSQVEKQSISKERVTSQALAGSLAHLVIPRQLIRRLGPAVNSARALLLYGPSGNGKTSISEAIARSFTQSIYVPYCIEVDGQIIRRDQSAAVD